MVTARQATEKLSIMTTNEIEALGLLTKAGCSSIPTLYSWHWDKQNDEVWVPSGRITYMLMEKLPGTEINSLFSGLDRKEQDELRAVFKKGMAVSFRFSLYPWVYVSNMWSGNALNVKSSRGFSYPEYSGIERTRNGKSLVSSHFCLTIS